MTSDDLDRARRSAPIEELSLERLHQRRDRKEGRRRIAALITALVIAAGVIFGVVTLKTDSHGVGAAGGGTGGSGGAGALAPGGLPAPHADLTIPDGSYYAGTYADYYLNQQDGTYSENSVSWWRKADGSGRIGDKTYASGEFPGEGGGVTDLTADPTVLRDEVIARMQPTGASPEPYDQFTPGPGQPDQITAGLWRSIADPGSGLLLSPQASPALKAALVQVLAACDGVQTIEASVDPAGRPAIEITSITEGIRHQLWVDPSTYQPEAWRNVDIPDAQAYEVALILNVGAAPSADALDIGAPLVPVLDTVPTAADLGLS
jgi:hypothetical protein